MKSHYYTSTLKWTGNLGSGTSGYKEYSRDFELSSEKKPVISGSSDPAFRGSPERYNPEELLVQALSSCHMLWYLHLCANAGIVVESYVDDARGIMKENPDGSGQFESVLLAPEVIVSDSEMTAKAYELHFEVHNFCFIARSVSFIVEIKPIIKSLP